MTAQEAEQAGIVAKILPADQLLDCAIDYGAFCVALTPYRPLTDRTCSSEDLKLFHPYRRYGQGMREHCRGPTVVRGDSV